jgi:hypothetical protein
VKTDSHSQENYSVEVNFLDELKKVGDFIRREYRLEAVRTCGNLLERSLRNLIQRLLNEAPAAARRKIVQAEEAICGPNDEQGYKACTLGRLWGVCRKAHVLEAAQRHLDLPIDRILTMDIGRLVEWRNQATHSDAIDARDMHVFYIDLLYLLEETGLLTSDDARELTIGPEGIGPPPPEPPDDDARELTIGPEEIGASPPEPPDIDLGARQSLGWSDFALQLMVWVPATLIIAICALVYRMMETKALAVVIDAFLLAGASAIAYWWFILPRRDRVRNVTRGRHTLSKDRPEAAVRVPGSTGWADTGVHIVAGKRYKLTATGFVQHSMFSGEHDADGNACPISLRSMLRECRGTDRNGAEFRVAALVGRVNPGGEPFVIGVECGLESIEDGRLYVGVNDWPRFDNKGEFLLRIRLPDIAQGETDKETNPGSEKRGSGRSGE